MLYAAVWYDPVTPTRPYVFENYVQRQIYDRYPRMFVSPETLLRMTRLVHAHTMPESQPICRGLNRGAMMAYLLRVLVKDGPKTLTMENARVIGARIHMMCEERVCQTDIDGLVQFVGGLYPGVALVFPAATHGQPPVVPPATADVARGVLEYMA